MGARVRSILGEGTGWLGAGRCLDSDGGRLGAGTDSVEGRARAARCGHVNKKRTDNLETGFITWIFGSKSIPNLFWKH